MDTSKPQSRTPASSPTDRAGDRDVFAELYDQLHALAGSLMRHERDDHTLQPTALVHEAFLRMNLPADHAEEEWRLLAFAANAMRQALIDHARKKKALKRGGGGGRVALDTSFVGGTTDEVDFLELDDAMERLAALDARKARVVEMKFFSRMTHEQIGRALDVSAKTVEADWYFARAWLRREMNPASD